MAKRPAKTHDLLVFRAIHRDLVDAYHRGDGDTVGRLLGTIRAYRSGRPKAASRATVRKATPAPPVAQRKSTDQFPPPPRPVRAAVGWSRRLRHYRDLIRDGAIIPGVVTGVRISHNGHERELAYAYRPPFAPTYIGVTLGPNAERPALGDTVMVFYDARRPASSVAYEASGFEIEQKATP